MSRINQRVSKLEERKPTEKDAMFFVWIGHDKQGQATQLSTFRKHHGLPETAHVDVIQCNTKVGTPFGFVGDVQELLDHVAAKGNRLGQTCGVTS